MSDSIIRVGDKVRVINPIVIDRVGYDNNLAANVEIIEEKYAGQVNLLISEVFNTVDFNAAGNGRVKEGILKALAYGLLKQKCKSGSERKLFTSKSDSLEVGKEYEVVSVRYVKTGKYNPPGGSYDYCGGWDYENGYLSDEKTHKLLKLTWGGEIEAINVEKVKP